MWEIFTLELLKVLFSEYVFLFLLHLFGDHIVAGSGSL